MSESELVNYCSRGWSCEMFERSDIDSHFSHIIRVSLGFNAIVSEEGGSAGGRCIRGHL